MRSVKLARPLILDGLLTEFESELSTPFFEEILSNVREVRDINYGSASPFDIKNVFVPFKEKYVSRQGFAGYLINYHGFDILVWDNNEKSDRGKGEEGTSLPDELFEI